jgi:hypothetical protein
VGSIPTSGTIESARAERHVCTLQPGRVNVTLTRNGVTLKILCSIRPGV